MQSSLTCQFEHSGKVRSGLIGNFYFYFHCYQVRPHFLCILNLRNLRTELFRPLWTRQRRERDKREKSEEKIDCHHQDSNQGPSFIYIYIYLNREVGEQNLYTHNNKVVSFIIPKAFHPFSSVVTWEWARTKTKPEFILGVENQQELLLCVYIYIYIFLRASSSHYTTIRMYGAVEKCGKQHMRGMQYQNKHVIKLYIYIPSAVDSKLFRP